MSVADPAKHPRRLAHTVRPPFDGETVLAVLRRAMLVSDATARRAKVVEDGIMLEGVRCKTNEVVRSGQVVSIVIDDATAEPGDAVKAEPGSLSIIYEDEDLLIVDKPAGLVVHPGPGHESATLCNFVAHHLKSAGSAGTARPVQRLDRTTSGLMVFAKNAHVQDRLQRQMHTRCFERTYLAICAGSPQPESGAIDAPIARISRGPSVFAVREDGKRAVTHYETLARWRPKRLGCANGPETAHAPRFTRGSEAGSASQAAHEPATLSLVKLDLETGRTHQIRLHMRHIGRPLLGDEAYGEPSTVIDRAALHSWRLRMTHPLTGASIELTCAPPQDMKDALGGIDPSTRRMLGL